LNTLSTASRWLSSVLAWSPLRGIGVTWCCAGRAGPGRELTAQSLPLPPVPGDQPRQDLGLVFAGLMASAASMMAPTIISS
jgi:hypothetical protein